jgi:hypothetical protein
MSWEIAIDSCFEDIKKELVKYTNSDDFKFEWKYWEAHCGGVCSRFRRSILYILGIELEANFTTNLKFVMKTNTLLIILKIIEHSICSQFNLMYKLLPLHIRNNQRKININAKLIITEALNRIEPNSYPSLYGKLCEEYKHFWHSAEKIQIQWRKSISDPSYIICQKRLRKEYLDLT